MEIKKVVIIGLGGVGKRLAEPLCRFLAYKHPKAAVVLIDGDNFGPENAERQVFRELGNKAEVSAKELREQFPGLTIETKPHYVTEDNVFVFVPDGSHVFCCVDNHASRKLLSEHVGGLSNAVLISGGNDFDDGNIQVYVREGGKDVTSSLTKYHDEIAKPKDKNPAELSCEELAATSTPQLIFANLKVAAEMAVAFWVVTQQGVAYDELYFDLKTGKQRPTLRKE